MTSLLLQVLGAGKRDDAATFDGSARPSSASTSSSLNLLSLLVEYLSGSDTGAASDPANQSIADTLFKLVGSRLAFGDEEQSSHGELKASEWRAFRVAMVVVSAELRGPRDEHDGDEVATNRALSDFTDATIKIITLSAARCVSQLHAATESSLPNHGLWWRVHIDGRPCARCEFMKSVMAVVSLVQSAADGEPKKRRLEALLVALLPIFFENLCTPAAPCSVAFSQFLGTILRWAGDPLRLRGTLFDAGVPHALLTSAAALWSARGRLVASGEDNLRAMFLFAESYMLLYGHDLVDASATDREAWCFVFSWFAVELASFEHQYGNNSGNNSAIASEIGMKAAVHVASEILTDVQNQRLSFAWPAARRKFAALLLVETCATGGIVSSYGSSSAIHSRSIELLGSSVAALDALLRSSTFSALLDSGELDESPSIFALLKLIAAANCHVQSKIQLPRNLADRIVMFFRTHVDDALSAHRMTPAILSVLASLPTSATSWALTAGLLHVRVSDIADMIRQDPRLSLQLLVSLSATENAGDSKTALRLRRAFVCVCRGLGDALYSGQTQTVNKSIACDDEAIKVLELLLRRILSASRSGNAPTKETPDARKLLNDEVRQATRAFSMTLLHACASRQSSTNLLRYVALLFDALWRETKFDGASFVHDEFKSDILLWCLNSANTALVHATTARRQKPDWSVLKTLGPYFDTFVALMMRGGIRGGPCTTAALVTIKLFVLATPCADEVDGLVRQSSRSTWRRGVFASNLLPALELALDAVDLTYGQPDDTACLAADVKSTMACWTIAALLRSRAAVSAKIPKALNEMIKLRMQEVLASPLGLRGEVDGACAALVRLLALEVAPRDNRISMSTWFGFTGRWLVHQERALPPYAALCVRDPVVFELESSRRLQHCSKRRSATGTFDAILSKLTSRLSSVRWLKWPSRKSTQTSRVR